MLHCKKQGETIPAKLDKRACGAFHALEIPRLKTISYMARCASDQGRVARGIGVALQSAVQRLAMGFQGIEIAIENARVASPFAAFVERRLPGRSRPRIIVPVRRTRLAHPLL